MFHGAPSASWFQFLRGLLCIAVVVFCATSTRAEDSVVYIPPGLSKPVTAQGEILNVTGMRLTLQQLSGEPLSMPMEAVRSYQTHYDASHARAKELFTAGDTVAATTAFREALGREGREWVQREILASLCQCALRQQETGRALSHFRQIMETDPSSLAWGIAPLAWSPATLTPALKTEAQSWLRSQRPTDRLLGASWLLLDATSGFDARRVLQDLSRDANPRLADYARAQLWRQDIAKREVTELTLDSWRDQIARMPAEMRAGPQYLIGKGCELLGNARGAAAELLWLPYVYPQSEPLASRALLEAGELLEKTGLVREASVVYQEQVTRYAAFPEAPLSRARLAALSTAR